MKKLLSYAIVFALGIGLSAATLKATTGLSSHATMNESEAKQAVLASLNMPPAPVHRNDSVVADAVAKVEPAVVEVHTLGKARSVGNPFGFGFDDPMLRRFFGDGDGPGDQKVQPKGAGSGVIISDTGYVLTNNHVVEDAETVTVNIGEKAYTAKVIGADKVSDIAVVKIDTAGAKIPVAALGNSDTTRVGDWAIAVGNPLNIGTTVTLGIISALNKTKLQAEGHPLNSVIQTDAAINPGNSGGALANINGEVIGINEAIYSPTGSYVGIGFAIPINSAKKIAAELIKNGKIIRPYLGVAFMPLKSLSAEARTQVGIEEKGDDGVVISKVSSGSPADEAGLQIYDVILQANGKKITDANQLGDMIQKLKVGDTVTLLVSHGGQNTIKAVKLKERPASFDAKNFQQDQGQGQGQDQP
jgi:serine protease Do